MDIFMQFFNTMPPISHVFNCIKSISAFLAKLASHKRDTNQIEPRTYVMFRLYLNWTMNGKSLKKL